ncbi:hypothetical protein D7V86_25760 [bacterium D16-51]|nr:hypothetical protein D7V96_26330 [bacterium D16-59]RKI52675.1 hypothetical protein D7V86_25760 [bacterium D16-51]
MTAYSMEVIRCGTVVADGVDSLEDAEGYIEGCNPVDEVRWSDSLGGMQGGTELQKISIPDAMAVREFAEKIEVRPAEIIKWLFLCGKTVSNNSSIRFADMKEFADVYGFICERDV